MSTKPKSGSRNNNRRNLLIAILVIVLVASSLFAYTMIMNNDSNNVKTEAELRNAIDKAAYEKPVTIIIDNDITLSRGTLVIPVGKNITLASKNNVEIFKLISATSYTTLNVEGELILDGLCVTHTTGSTGTGVTISTGGIFTMYNSEISNNNAGGVYNSGIFKMYGGTISNNAADNGGGISNSGTFEMYSGKITDNTATVWGGGVNNGGIFSIYGGSIFDNTARVGGGVFCNNPSTFNNFGGTISGNTATYYDGDIYQMT